MAESVASARVATMANWSLSAPVATASSEGLVSSPASSSDTTECNTEWATWYLGPSSAYAAWFKETTYWCWNGAIVTTHTTTYDEGLTAIGIADQWEYQGIVGGSEGWHCYVAAGGSRPCSGNTEYAEGQFEQCLLHLGCDGLYWNPEAQLWQNYHGGYGAGSP